MKKENKKSKEEFVKLYVPELRQLVESGDEKMCLVMAQCEYWFGHKPDGFYKFMSPVKGDNPSLAVVYLLVSILQLPSVNISFNP